MEHQYEFVNFDASLRFVNLKKKNVLGILNGEKV